MNKVGPSLAKRSLEAFFIRINLRGTLSQETLRFDNVRWDKTVQNQLHLRKHRSALKNVKFLKIWIATPFDNQSFDENIMRIAFERGGALPMEPVATAYSKAHNHLNTVPPSDTVGSLDYGEPPRLPKTLAKAQPTWFTFGTDSSETVQTPTCSGSSGSGAPEQGDWRDARLSDLEHQLKTETAAREATQSINAGLEWTITLHGAISSEARTEVYQLRKLLESRDQILASTRITSLALGPISPHWLLLWRLKGEHYVEIVTASKQASLACLSVSLPWIESSKPLLRLQFS